MAEQIPFGEVGLPPVAEPRCPCVLLLDVSASMSTKDQSGRSRIEYLNEGMQAYRNEVMADSLAIHRIEPAVVTFSDQVQVVAPFATMDQFQPPFLTTGGLTNLGAAVLRSVDMIEERKKYYRQHGLPYFRPWIFLLTDGEPTDDWSKAAKCVHDGERDKKFVFFAIGVGEANLQTLAALSVRRPLRLMGLRFREMFKWLSQSQRAISQSQPGLEGSLVLPNPTGPEGWATLD
jgi:uncharacterized protein YegL